MLSLNRSLTVLWRLRCIAIRLASTNYLSMPSIDLQIFFLNRILFKTNCTCSQKPLVRLLPFFVICTLQLITRLIYQTDKILTVFKHIFQYISTIINPSQACKTKFYYRKIKTASYSSQSSTTKFGRCIKRLKTVFV